MYKILLVDDEPLILQGLEHLIDWAEYGIEIAGRAASGEEAITLLEQTAVDIVLTDIRMPHLGGLDIIEYVKSKELNTRCIILSGYDDFAYVKKAAMLGIDNYLLKPVNKDELSDTLLNVVNKLSKRADTHKEQRYVREALNILWDSVLLRLVAGSISQQEFYEKCQFLNKDFDYERFFIAVVRIIRNHLSPERAGPQDRSLIHYAAHNIGQEMMRDCNGVNGAAFQDQDDDLVLLFMDNGEMNETDQIYQLLNRTIASINSLLKQEVFVTVGTIVSEQTDIHQSYAKAKSLQIYSLIYPPNQVMDVMEIDRQRNRREANLKIKFEEFEAAIVKRNKEEAARFILDVYAHLERLEQKTPTLVQNVTIEILFHLVRIANHNSHTENELLLDGKEVFIQILSKNRIGDIADAMVELVNQLINVRNKNDNPLIQKVLQVIHESYATDISLQSLADTLFLNVVYLGQLFKKETGQLFSAYLNQYRVEKAKELLLGTALTAKQIAQEVGYANPDYFYIIFKKITGMSPSEFKQ